MFVVDVTTGSAPVQHLYYLRIILAAVRFGFRGGVTAPLAAIVLGDEFVIALRGGAKAGGQAVADDVRRAVCTTKPRLAGLEFPTGALSVSVGVACLAVGSHRKDDDDATIGEELFCAADRALYRAKQRGRNQVCLAWDVDDRRDAVADGARVGPDAEPHLHTRP